MEDFFDLCSQMSGTNLTANFKIVDSATSCVEARDRINKDVSKFPVLGLHVKCITLPVANTAKSVLRRPKALQKQLPTVPILQIVTPQNSEVFLFLLDILKEVPECIKVILTDANIIKVCVTPITDRNYLFGNFKILLESTLDLRVILDTPEDIVTLAKDKLGLSLPTGDIGNIFISENHRLCWYSKEAFATLELFKKCVGLTFNHAGYPDISSDWFVIESEIMKVMDMPYEQAKNVGLRMPVLPRQNCTSGALAEPLGSKNNQNKTSEQWEIGIAEALEKKAVIVEDEVRYSVSVSKEQMKQRKSKSVCCTTGALAEPLVSKEHQNKRSEPWEIGISEASEKRAVIMEGEGRYSLNMSKKQMKQEKRKCVCAVCGVMARTRQLKVVPKVYLGFKERIAEHRQGVGKPDTQSAFAQHINTHSHACDFDNFKILHVANKGKLLDNLETIEIREAMVKNKTLLNDITFLSSSPLLALPLVNV